MARFQPVKPGQIDSNGNPILKDFIIVFFIGSSIVDNVLSGSTYYNRFHSVSLNFNRFNGI